MGITALNNRDKEKKQRATLSRDDVRLFYADKDRQKQISEEMGAAIKHLLDEKNLSYDEVAKMLGLSNKSAVSHIVNGKTKIGVFHLLNFAELLDVDVRRILYPKEELAPDPAAGGEPNLINAVNLENALAYIKSDWQQLDPERAMTLAMHAARNIGPSVVSEKEIRSEINNIISQRLNGTAPESK